MNIFARNKPNHPLGFRPHYAPADLPFDAGKERFKTVPYVAIYPAEIISDTGRSLPFPDPLSG